MGRELRSGHSPRPGDTDGSRLRNHSLPRHAPSARPKGARGGQVKGGGGRAVGAEASGGGLGRVDNWVCVTHPTW